eukprot:2262407-Amphidinium_carterae.2
MSGCRPICPKALGSLSGRQSTHVLTLEITSAASNVATMACSVLTRSLNLMLQVSLNRRAMCPRLSSRLSKPPLVTCMPAVI